MLNTMPKGGAVQETEPGRMAWLTKWFRGDQSPAPQAVATPQAGAGGAPIMAYQPPPSAPVSTQTAQGNRWQGFSPTAAAATTPVPAMASYPAAQSEALSGVAPTIAPNVVSTATDCKALREEGHALDRAGRLAEAEAVYRRAIGADPSSAAAVNDLALCLARQGKMQPSTAAFRQAIMMRPDKQLYRNNIATVLVEQGQADEALAHLKTVYGPATAHFNLGQLLTRAGQQDKAIKQLQLALAADPTMTSARQALAGLTPQPPAMPTPTLAATQPMAPAYPAHNIAAAPKPAASQPSFEPTLVAAAPQPVAAPQFAQPQVAPPTVAQPPVESAAGVPSFPRLLPPVLDR